MLGTTWISTSQFAAFPTDMNGIPTGGNLIWILPRVVVQVVQIDTPSVGKVVLEVLSEVLGKGKLFVHTTEGNDLYRFFQPCPNTGNNLS